MAKRPKYRTLGKMEQLRRIQEIRKHLRDHPELLFSGEQMELSKSTKIELERMADYILAGEQSRRQGLLPRRRRRNWEYAVATPELFSEKAEQSPDYSQFDPNNETQMIALLSLPPRRLFAGDPLSILLYELERAKRRAPLTCRERTALRLLMRGETQAQIAERLHVTQSAISRLLHAAARKIARNWS